MITISAADLAARVKARAGLEQATIDLMRETLRAWKRRGIAEQVGSGWRLTESGFAMFGGYVLAFDADDAREAA